MKSKSAFEERLIACSSEAALKAAKLLLKNERVKGAYRDGEGIIHAIFEEKNGVRIHVSLRPGDPPQAECDCPATSDAEHRGELCEHALALWMYSLLFRVPERTAEIDNESANYIGLKNAGLEALAKECAAVPTAEVVMQAESAFPHVPSKWENAVLSVRLRAGKREYLGNLNNLRQLFFDKTLAVTLKLEDFSLQDRQIIRFLAINGEADSSKVLLNSELTSELFHALGGFPRFFRNGRRLIIHTEAPAEAVVLTRQTAHGCEYSSGIRFRGALLEIHSAKVITGKSGCWVGKNGEYFWISSPCEIGFLRNFFRLGLWDDRTPGSGAFLAAAPFEKIRFDGAEPPEKRVAVRLDGALRSGALALKLRFVYDCDSFVPDAGRLVPGREGFWKRNETLEASVIADLKMLKAEGDFAHGDMLIRDSEAVGTFLNEVIAEWEKRFPKLLLDGELARLANGGSGLEALQLSCEGGKALNASGNYALTGRWHDRAGGAATWNAVEHAAKHRFRYLPLDNGRVAYLAPEAAESVLKLVRAVQKLNYDQGTFELPHLALNYFGYLVRHWHDAMPQPLLGALYGSAAPVAITVPKSVPLEAKLRSYQIEGVEWMRRMLANGFNVILADEMGLGKTVQALATVNLLRAPGDAPALVVAPASLIENWERECHKFLPTYKVGAIYGASRDEVLQNLTAFDLLVVSYTLARREIARLSKTLFALVILDEAQHIKNPGTANAQSCKSLRAKHKLVLTGTPLENSPEDLWSIFDFLHPGFLGTFSGFKKEFAEIASSSALRSDLAARVAPFIKRRNKTAVAPELPPREEHNAFCSMEAEQRALYEAVLAEGRNQLAKLESDPAHPSRGNMEILTTLLRLRQICCHPALLDAGRQAATPSAKFELLEELVNENLDSGHKMLIFSQFTSVLALIRDWLDAAKIRYSYLDGATRNRQSAVDEFNNTPEIPIFLLSLKAGGTGLNLTAADTVIIYDPWWNPAAEMQAADRTHRIGQTKPVRTLKLLVNDSIEEKILRLQEKKRELFDQVVDNPALAAEKFTLDELKFLLH